MPNFWPRKGLWPLKNLEQWLPMREFLKLHLTEKKSGYLRSGQLQEVVAYEKRSLGES